MEQEIYPVINFDDTICNKCKQIFDTIPGKNVCSDCNELFIEEENERDQRVEHGEPNTKYDAIDEDNVLLSCEARENKSSVIEDNQSTKSDHLEVSEIKDYESYDICISCGTEIVLKYCQDCGDALCKPCSEIHQRQKSTKFHKLVDAHEASKQTSTLCDNCNDSGNIQLAIKYCEQCESFLCNACSDYHLRQKITKLHLQVDVKEAKNHTMAQCTICDGIDNTQPATSYCGICESFLCKPCTQMHKRNQNTKSHQLVDAKEAPEQTAPLCDDCNDNNEEQPAIRYCKVCECFLCKTCSSYHQRQKNTRSHELVDAKEAPKQTPLLCDDCNDNDEEQPAIKYCKTCESLLCKMCSTFHLRHKSTRSHELVDAKEAPKPALTLCNDCKDSNEEQPAIKYCKICESFFCKSCSVFHLRQRIYKLHELVDAKEAPKQTPTLCDICIEINEEQLAIKHCKECESLLCKKCSALHQRQKTTRKHELLDAKEAPKQTPTLCDICIEINEEQLAIKYCKECENLLCKKCSALHQRQITTRKHELLDAKKAPKQTPTLCEICYEVDEEQPAIKYCKECKSLLCKTCSRHHQRQKDTKSHDLVDAKEAPKQTPTLCDICIEINEEQLAIKYCKECKSLLCKKCSALHQRQITTRKHELLDAKEAPKQTHTLCEICYEVDEEQPAIKYCKECKSLFCKTCSRHHQRQKDTKSHDLVDAKEAPVHDIYQEEPSDELKRTSEKEKTKPEKPTAMNVTSDSMDLYWECKGDASLISHYQIRYKDVDKDPRWKLLPNEYVKAPATISNIKADTKYVFQIRAVFGDDEGPYGDTSDEIFTLQSPATRLVQYSVRVRDGEPAIYALPLTESKPARNEQAKTRKFDVGAPPLIGVQEKTIMLVGATGTGKSTLVDGIVNYILGVKWNDPFRFTLEKLEAEEAAHKGNQALSQTEWITCYTINPEQGSRFDYKLTIIDTPGFGDTRGLERDNETVAQIRQLFSAPDKKGVVFIDAVCFLIKAPDARLTATQTYIFNAILSLYGNDIVDNIRTLVTFADGKDPPVLAALKESNLPFGRHFTFNNSGLFANNKNLDTSSLSPMFWEMGLKSFREFFLDLVNMKSVSLSLSKEVLEERQRLELSIMNLQPQVDAGLAKIAALKKEHELIAQHEVDIKSNKNFEYETEEVVQVQKELEPGVHTTNCLLCNYTCHKRCGYADDKDKANCIAMDSSGNCKECPKRCKWNDHKNTRYIFEYMKVKVKKTYDDMKKKYETAAGKKLNAEQVLGKMVEDFSTLQDNIECLMCVVNQSRNRLKDIALRPNPLSMVEHIDLMIQSEKMDQKDGYLDRIKALMEYRKKATITSHVDKLNEEAKGVLKDTKKEGGHSISSLLTKIKNFFF